MAVISSTCVIKQEYVCIFKLIIYNIFNLSSFTICEANYRLTLGYRGIVPSFLTK